MERRSTPFILSLYACCPVCDRPASIAYLNSVPSRIGFSVRLRTTSFALYVSPTLQQYFSKRARWGSSLKMSLNGAIPSTAGFRS